MGNGSAPPESARGPIATPVFNLDHIGLANFFDAIVGTEDTTKHIPEPDVFLEVARRISVEPTACEIFEDADLGVEAGRRAGMPVFDVRTVHQPQRMT